MHATYQRLNYPVYWKDGSSEGFGNWMGFVKQKGTGVEVLKNQRGGYRDF